MTTPFDNASNPFADNTPAPAPAAAAEPAQGEAAPVQPLLADPFGGAQQAAQPQQSPLTPQGTAFASASAPASAQQFGSAPFPQGTQEFNNNTHNRKYKIFDLYWLINMKLYQGVALDNNECSILNISYNIDFDNLRIGFCQPNSDTFTKTSLAVRNVNKVTNINVYSETAEQLIDLIGIEGDGQIQNVERVFNSNWSANSTIFAKQGDNIIIQTSSQDGTYTFTLHEWQKRALNHACLFLLKEARVLTLSRFQ